MQTFHFDPVSGEYLYACNAFADPLASQRAGEAVFLLPRNATFTAPPEEKTGTVRIWDGHAWCYVPDHRGKTVWQSYSVSMEIKQLGDIPEGWSLERPEALALSVEERLAILENAVQQHLDMTAQSRGYDSSYSCLSYLSSSDSRWKHEAQAFNLWRDSVWQKCHALFEDFTSGKIHELSAEELIALLPEISWQEG